MVHDALHHMKLDGLDLLFIENVGNLVCPASFDLGQHRNVTLLSTPEGDDKPAKYPVMFRAADLVLLTKTDLLPLLDDFLPDRAEHYLRQLASQAPMLQVAAGKHVEITGWLTWLHREIQSQKERIRKGQTVRPAIQPEGRLMHAPTHKAHHEHTHTHPATQSDSLPPGV